MKIYNYVFNMKKCEVRIVEYECSQVKYKEKEGYCLTGLSRFVSKNRIETFSTFKSGNFLLAWSLKSDESSKFKKRCLDKVIELRDRTARDYDFMALELIKQIEKEVN